MTRFLRRSVTFVAVLCLALPMWAAQRPNDSTRGILRVQSEEGEIETNEGEAERDNPNDRLE